MTKLQKLIDIANKEYDGHFTLMKFTTDWECCFVHLMIHVWQAIKCHMVIQWVKRLKNASASTRIDETTLGRIIVLGHKKVKYIGNV